jgi:hypothetical protein
MLQTYFEAKIGDVLCSEVTTGQDGVRCVYGRRYKAEILAVLSGGEEVVVNLASQDLTPSGHCYSQTDIRFGDIHVAIADLDGLEAFWLRLLSQADPAMAPHWHLGPQKRQSGPPHSSVRKATLGLIETDVGFSLSINWLRILDLALVNDPSNPTVLLDCHVEGGQGPTRSVIGITACDTFLGQLGFGEEVFTQRARELGLDETATGPESQDAAEDMP